MEHQPMKTIAILSLALLTTAFAGCVVAPARGGYGYEAPPGVVYIEPSYASPGPGYVWEYHARYGWGWHHPQHGWHRGWQ
ncbi:MAG: hypothetical protein ACXWIZ_00850 [Caldimonas sp.]